jgi:hypothetical protein
MNGGMNPALASLKPVWRGTGRTSRTSARHVRAPVTALREQNPNGRIFFPAVCNSFRILRNDERVLRKPFPVIRDAGGTLREPFPPVRKPFPVPRDLFPTVRKPVRANRDGVPVVRELGRGVRYSFPVVCDLSRIVRDPFPVFREPFPVVREAGPRLCAKVTWHYIAATNASGASRGQF